MKHKTQIRKSLLDNDTVLQFINGEDISAIVIDFYSGYIFKISELVITDSENDVEVKYVDKDLVQSLNLSVIECLPNLRRNIKRHLDPNDDFEIRIKAE